MSILYTRRYRGLQFFSLSHAHKRFQCSKMGDFTRLGKTRGVSFWNRGSCTDTGTYWYYL